MKILNWISVLVGIWLIISPWVLNFQGMPNATWNSVIFGIIVGIIGLIQSLGGSSGKKEESSPTV